MITNNLYGAIYGSFPSDIGNGIKYQYFFQGIVLIVGNSVKF